jgi:acid phosphatase
MRVDATTRPFRRVTIVVLENTNYDTVLGNSAMPWLNSAIVQHSLSTQYFANTHPSIGNYFMLATGQILSNDSNLTPATYPVSAPNIVRSLLNAGRTWKSYAEGLPSVGYIGGNNTSTNYAVRHNPFAYLSVVQTDPVQRQNLVPFSQFSPDLSAGELPDFSFISPDLCNSGHDCGLAVVDSWLQTHIQPLLQDARYSDDGLLVIVFDEATNNDSSLGGGRIAVVVIAPARLSKAAGYRSVTTYQHESLLRLALESLGVRELPGASANAAAMWEFFSFAPPT